MTIAEAFQLPHTKSCLISFVGAGGKTTCMFTLAEELIQLGTKVLVTTTTKIWYPEASQYDRLIIQSRSEGFWEQLNAAEPGTIIVVAQDVLWRVEKLKGFSPEFLDTVRHAGLVDYILVEADGSSNKPVKAPAEHEPVVPASTDLVVGLTGFDCYGKPIDGNTVFRLNEFCRVSGKSAGQNIDATTLLSLIRSPYGLFKAVPAKAKKIWMFNQVDTCDMLKIAEDVSQYIFSQSPVLNAIILSALNHEQPIKKVMSRR
ncbi:putative selenium-dependent hydroxylase accessory protein YqeC [candidate division KSB3 bacterium]|uniref:Putative selenium-dependent hydroxylase accessory protein YqeC n=1 Tax=candidate division KSB3 bacterium TaxID=2044937 RepID=A0A2G6KKV3_9BACT|nr:MAG: putative selenium-dependent hydroxylase accessory protein YqeC [candidate division KSB3 bacterium]